MNEVQRQYECPERGRSIRQFFRSPIQLVSSYICIVGLEKVLVIPLRRDKVMGPMLETIVVSKVMGPMPETIVVSKVMGPMPETIVVSKVMGPMPETIVVGSLICIG